MDALLHEIIGLFILMSCFALLTICIKILFHYVHADQETERKAFHIGTGLCLLPMPWLFHSITSVALLMSIPLLAPVIIPLWPRAAAIFGRSLNVNRRNFGIPLFALTYIWLYYVTTDQKYIYVSACLIMIFADAVAAIIGTHYPLGRFKLVDTAKSFSGSIAFFFTSVLAISLSIGLFTDISPIEQISKSLIVAGIATSLEALCFAGFDNFVVPVTVFYVLRWLS